MTFTDHKTVRNLANANSQIRGTSLVTLYVPGKTNMGQITTHLTSEMSQTGNIKDQRVRKSVQGALRSASQRIKSAKMNVAPEKGFVLCAGEIGSCV